MGKHGDEHWAAVKSVLDVSRRVGFAAIDSQGTVLDCTGTFASLLGRDLIDVQGRTLADFKFNRDRPAHRRKLDQLFSEDPEVSGRVVSAIYSYRSPAGSRISLHFEGHGILEEDGAVDTAVIWVHDVPETERELVEMQAQLEDVTAQLQQLSERTVINVVGQGNNQLADRGGSNANTTTTNQPVVVWAVVAAVALIAVVAVVLALGGDFSLTHTGGGEGTIEVTD